MFEAFKCDSITVPSCSKHNTEKSSDDLAILAFLIRGIYPCIRTGTLTNNALLAIEHAHNKINESKSVKGKKLIEGRVDDLGTEFSYINDENIIENWILQLTAAIVWSATGYHDNNVNYGSFNVWSENYHPGNNPFDINSAAEKTRELQITRVAINKRAGKWWKGWSAYKKQYPPDIYRFSIAFVDSDKIGLNGSINEMIIQHRFYGQFSWYVFMKISKSIVNDVRSALNMSNNF
jgi:hypothetical protein